MKSLFKFTLYSVFALLLFSCSPNIETIEEEINTDPDQNLPSLDIPSGFDFKTSNDVKITIYDSEPGTLYKVYTEFGATDVADDEAELAYDEVVKDGIIYKYKFSAVTIDGGFEQQLQIPTYSNKVFIRRKGTDGFTDYTPAIVNDNVTLTHSKKATKTNSEKDVTTIKKNLNSDVFIDGDARVVGGFNSNGFDVEVTGNLSISGQTNLNGTTTIIANSINAAGNVHLNGAVVYADSFSVAGNLYGSGYVYYCSHFAVAGNVYNNQNDDIPQQQCGNDSDGDGVSDGDDAFPDDVNKAFIMYGPSPTGYGTLVFEDLWPSFGDYDFNDVALSYRAMVILNAQNQAVQVDFLTRVKSNGAAFTNAFGIELEGVPSSSVASVSGPIYSHNYLSFNANGTEANQDNAVIIFTDDQDNFMEETTVSVSFNQPISTNQLGAVPFNPFIIKNRNRAYEIHLPYYNRTTLGRNATDFSGANRDSDGNYISENGYPWALSILEDIAVPKEKVRIDEAYNFFGRWATSGGSNNEDWYKNLPGHINNDKLK